MRSPFLTSFIALNGKTRQSSHPDSGLTNHTLYPKQTEIFSFSHNLFHKLIHSGYHAYDLLMEFKRAVNLMQWVKIAHSFLQSLSNLFHFIIFSLPM